VVTLVLWNEELEVKRCRSASGIDLPIVEMFSNDPAWPTSLPDGPSTGETIVVTVTRPAQTLTGFVDFALGELELSSTVTGRIEQEATWTETAPQGLACP
jgi:hypothetical protein